MNPSFRVAARFASRSASGPTSIAKRRSVTPRPARVAGADAETYRCAVAVAGPTPALARRWSASASEPHANTRGHARAGETRAAPSNARRRAFRSQAARPPAKRVSSPQ